MRNCLGPDLTGRKRAGSAGLPRYAESVFCVMPLFVGPLLRLERSSPISLDPPAQCGGLNVLDGDPIWAICMVEPESATTAPSIKLALWWKITKYRLYNSKSGTSRQRTPSFNPLIGTNDGDQKANCSEQGKCEAEHGPKNPGRQKPLKHELTQTCAFSQDHSDRRRRSSGI